MVGAVISLATLVGCSMGNHSNPTLSITSARVTSSRAILDVEVTNPSDYDLTLNEIDYSLTYGLFPVAQGTYRGYHTLPSGGSTSIRFPISFSSDPVDPGSEIELSGEMKLEDTSNKSRMQISAASFLVTAPVSR